MIQKLLALLFSLLVALSGALPSDLVGGESDVSDQSLALETHLDGEEPQPVNVLWVKIDGEKVTDDRWGVGTVDELTFKVGVHADPDATLRVGDEAVELDPTDVLAVEGFEGRFAFRSVGTADATIRLDGRVDRTSVEEGDRARISTEQGATDASSASASGSPHASPNASDTRHVVLSNGGPVGSVAVADGDARRLATGQGDEANPILAHWLQVDGDHVDRYLSGEGRLGTVTFQVGPGAGHQISLGGETATVEDGDLVRLRGFHGTYLVYDVEGGLSRVKLDGVASDVDLPGAEDTPGEGQAPVARFNLTPTEPTTSHTVTFQDRSYDPDGGRGLVYEWSFGDGTTSVDRNPSHSYDEPGTYHVTLEVTDEDLRTDVVTAQVDVGNTPPTAAFAYNPASPDDVHPTTFVSDARDTDGEVVRHEWSFDGTGAATGSDVSHTFPDDGTYQVTLTAVDDRGATDNVTRVVSVDNVPPEADFSYTPEQPRALDAVTFTSSTRDPDGSVQRHEWSFGDGATDTGRKVTHHFEAPGTYTVTLTTVDDDGVVETVTKTLEILNRRPEPDFEVATPDPVTAEPLSFQDQSVDRDGEIVAWLWRFGDGNISTARNPVHAYDEAGTYEVTLKVTDDRGGVNATTQTLVVENAPPQVDFVWTPDQPYDDNIVSFTDVTVDPDGDDDITSRYWTFGDGTDSNEADPTHRFPDNGTYQVTLHVEDSAGHNATTTHDVLVRNRPPVIENIGVEPVNPDSRDTITLSMEATDPDGVVETHEWDLPNGTTLTGRVVNVSLSEGVHAVTARAIDDDGAIDLETEEIEVQPAPPIANFTTDPDVPAAGQEIQFLDTSTPGDAPITDWNWNFGDGDGSNEQNPIHIYEDPGTYQVKLVVGDANGRSAVVERAVDVTAPPRIAFSIEPENPFTGATTYFNVTEASDPDGQVVDLRWNFSDSDTLVHGSNVTHVYDDAGTYEVTLIAEDDVGAITSKTKIVDVLNRDPDASFTYDPKNPLVGVDAVSFSDTSTDPDGNVTTRAWAFGDGATALGSDVSHTYTKSGLFPARLTVTDDDGATDRTTRTVRVVNDHPVTLEVHVRYPNGQPFDLTQPGVNSTFTVLETGLTAGDSGSKTVTETEDGLSSATFDAGEWAGGEPIRWRLDAPGIPTATHTFRPPADATKASKTLEIPVPLEAAIVFDDPHGTPVDVGSDTGTARYSNPLEPVTGRLVLSWATGVPARNTSATVDVDYDGSDPQSTPLDGHRDVAEVRVDTGPDGVANFTVPFTRENPFSGLPLMNATIGAYIPGWYEVGTQIDFRAQGRIVGQVLESHFLEDPAGLISRAGLHDRPSLVGP